MRFNAVMSSHFSGCRLLLERADVNRQRTQKVYHLPGEFEVVGISDGTDSWIAPVNAMVPWMPMIREMLGQIRNGEIVLPRTLSSLALTRRPIESMKVNNVTTAPRTTNANTATAADVDSKAPIQRRRLLHA